jgi:hypothetical protein
VEMVPGLAANSTIGSREEGPPVPSSCSVASAGAGLCGEHSVADGPH